MVGEAKEAGSVATRRSDDGARLDDAARAGWLYYVAGKTQDEIARALKISRQSAQRLVSLSVSAGLVKVRIDHPIAACLDLAARLRTRFDIGFAEVVPSDPGSTSTTLGTSTPSFRRRSRTRLMRSSANWRRKCRSTS